MVARAHLVTCTTYSRSSGWRWRARLAAATNSLRISINWSVVSGVNDPSPHFGQTQAGTLGMVTPMPSSLYLKVVVPHSITSPHSEQWGAGLCSLIFPFFARRISAISTLCSPLLNESNHYTFAVFPFWWFTRFTPVFTECASHAGFRSARAMLAQVLGVRKPCLRHRSMASALQIALSV